MEAQADDEELAALALAAPPRDDVPSGPRVSQWSPELEALAAINDRLGAVFTAVLATGQVKPPKVNPYPRPVTAIDRARSRARRMQHDALVSRVLER